MRESYVCWLVLRARRDRLATTTISMAATRTATAMPADMPAIAPVDMPVLGEFGLPSGTELEFADDVVVASEKICWVAGAAVDADDVDDVVLL